MVLDEREREREKERERERDCEKRYFGIKIY